MTWILLATLTALCESLKDITSKHNLKKFDQYLVTWSLAGLSLPFLLPLLLIVHIPPIQPNYWKALLVGGSLNIVAMVIYVKALNISELSSSVPLVTFTPLFLMITSPFLIGEYPTFRNFIGIIFLVTGSYFLNLKERKKGYLAPFKALVNQPGPRLMLLVAFIWSITSNIDKIGVQNSSAVFWGISIYGFIAVGLFPVIIYRYFPDYSQIPFALIRLLPIGLFNGLAILFQMQAITMALVAQVISIKRTSVLFTVLLGHLFLGEKGLQEKSSAALIMVIGVALILL